MTTFSTNDSMEHFENRPLKQLIHSLDDLRMIIELSGKNQTKHPINLGNDQAWLIDGLGLIEYNTSKRCNS
ncbi:hypothetical protein T07_1479 [Trichinella nelsoni]|uniref:Uncharacterized protein n=1 Tax=Trichinella nelsoni TaxID=6336 RepID=A0A0V0SDJ7_9BILA|nr:hypothetical protein T07_1479 [Trichinella nelsoni]